MKKVPCLLLLLFMGLGIPLYAQDFSYRAGARLGLNFGWFSGDDWDDTVDAVDGDSGVSLGTTFGGFLEIGISERFAVQPELLITRLRGRHSYEEDIAGDDVSVIVNLRVIELPILAKGRIPFGPGTVYGIAGPDLFFMLRDVSVEDVRENTRVIAYDDPDNRLLFGFVLGAGYERPFGPGVLSGEIRYTRVLSRYEGDYEAFPNAVSLSAGFSFPL